MITRGYFIGQIIDELTSVSEQVKNRDRLGLTDINIFIENFMRDILNEILDLNLKNLNDSRSNAPGLDLGDTAKRLAFQITSTKKLDKIHDTLDAAFALKSNYDEIYVLILQDKQKTSFIE